MASWDSSAHENSKLNRLTPDHERLYMIVKVTLRLSDPSPCGNDYFHHPEPHQSFRADLAQETLCECLPTTLHLELPEEKCWKLSGEKYNEYRYDHDQTEQSHQLNIQGVTYEIVSNVPDIHSESDWFGEIEDSLDDEDETIEETFFEKYAKAVSNVETLISLEKIKQADALSELLFKQEELHNRLSNNNSLR